MRSLIALFKKEGDIKEKGSYAVSLLKDDGLTLEGLQILLRELEKKGNEDLPPRTVFVLHVSKEVEEDVGGVCFPLFLSLLAVRLFSLLNGLLNLSELFLSTLSTVFRSKDFVCQRSLLDLLRRHPRDKSSTFGFEGTGVECKQKGEGGKFWCEMFSFFLSNKE